jgi:hypothetical protein
MGPCCSSAETQVCHRSYIIAANHKATKLYLKIPDVIHKSYQRLVWIYKKGDFVKFTKCNLLNSFFCSISNLDDTNRNPPNLELRTNSKLAIIEFTIKEISDILKSLNIKKPPGTI